MPTRPAPIRLIVWWLRGSVRVAAVAARCRVAPAAGRGRARDLERPRRTALRPSALHGSAGSSAQAEVAHHADDPTRPRRSARRAARHSAAHSAGSAPSRAMPVSRCRWTAGPAGARRRPPPGGPGPGRRRRCRRATAAAKSASTGLSQLSTGAASPASRSGERLVEAGDAEPGRAVGERGAGDVDGAVAEAVGLDHRHQLAGRAGGEEPGVRGDGGQVDVQVRPGAVGSGATAGRSRRAPPRATGP